MQDGVQTDCLGATIPYDRAHSAATPPGIAASKQADARPTLGRASDRFCQAQIFEPQP